MPSGSELNIGGVAPSGAAVKVTRWPKGLTMWVERFGLCDCEDVRCAGVLVSLAPHQVRGDGFAQGQHLSPPSSGARVTFNFDPSGRKTGANFC